VAPVDPAPLSNDDVRRLNQIGWDRRVDEGDIWSRPVSPEDIARARAGDWSVVLTPSKPVPADWFGDLRGRDVLCLASGGGQQGPVLAAAGARVIVFDASAGQLAQDALVARRDGLDLALEQGFMHDLSRFADDRFDLVFHPVSNCFAPEILPVWRECFRVLRPGGALLAGFMNPVVFIFDEDAEARGELVVRFPLPFADVEDRSAEDLAARTAQRCTLDYSHSLETQIGGQLAAGFRLTDLFEDRDKRPESLASTYFPTAIATRAVKPAGGEA
jgi:SAM-dependent methyltransferase